MDTTDEFFTVLLYNKITVYPYHNNISHKSKEHGCDRVLFHILVVKYYGEELKYIKGENNNVVESL